MVTLLRVGFGALTLWVLRSLRGDSSRVEAEDRNRVGLLVYGRFLDWTFPGYGKVQRERILLGLRVDRPAPQMMGAEDRGYYDGYGDQSPSDVGRRRLPQAGHALSLRR